MPREEECHALCTSKHSQQFFDGSVIGLLRGKQGIPVQFNTFSVAVQDSGPHFG